MKKLPDTELEVMQAIWSYEPPVTRAQISEILDAKHPMAATTLLTLLTRLESKGFIEIQKDHRISIYTPLITKKEYLASQSKSFFDLLCDGDVSTFATALCDSGISEEDIKELRELLEKGKL